MKCWLAVTFLLLMGGQARAQGLLWTLPPDGTWVRFEGTYSQTLRRPDSPEGDLNLQWRRNLTIKSVGTEEAEYDGQTQTCRWIEIRTETGKTSEGILDAGPGGIRMYRLLIPESAIRGTVMEPAGTPGRELFAAYIPVVKGVRRIGDEPAQDIESGVFQCYPVISLVGHYRDLEESGPEETVNTPVGDFAATPYQGKRTVETPKQRVTNQVELFRSPDSPFGVLKWTASTVEETKGTTDERSSYTQHMLLTEKMQLVATGTDAESDFLLE